MAAGEPAPFIVPENWDIEQKLSYLVGHLVIEWAGCESLFLGMFRCLVGGPGDDTAQLIWLSTNSNRARLDLVEYTCKTRGVSGNLQSEVSRLVKRYKVITRARNFWCHSYYLVDPTTFMPVSVEGARISDAPEVFRIEEKVIDGRTLAELTETIVSC